VKKKSLVILFLPHFWRPQQLPSKAALFPPLAFSNEWQRFRVQSAFAAAAATLIDVAATASAATAAAVNRYTKLSCQKHRKEPQVEERRVDGLAWKD
jgi:hypothetical protein